MNDKVQRLRCDLTAPVAPAACPAGYSVRTFAADDAPTVHRLLEAGYAHGGGHVGAFEEWWTALRNDDEFDADLCFLAVNKRQDIVGVAQCWTSAFVKDLVVHPLERRRGIASTLLVSAFAEFQRRGATHVDLKVQLDNPTGAVRLYKALGMREVPLDGRPSSEGHRVAGQASAIRPRLVIVEGIMGSGKTTTVLRATDKLRALGIPAIGITEGVNPHPIRYDWHCSWNEVRASDLMSAQLTCWQSYVSRSQAEEQMHLVDGQLFHGNLTAMFLLEAELGLMTEYCRKLVAIIAPLKPHLIYFRQDDVAVAIHTVAAQRGKAWVDYQTSWKLSSPYAVRRGLTGLDGLIVVYRAYRAITDQLFNSLEMPKLCIENSLGEWSKYDRLIDQTVLCTAPQFSTRP